MDSMTKGSFTISKIDFFEEWVKTSRSDKNAALFKFVASKNNLSGIMEQSLKEIKAVISRFSAKLLEKWEKSNRTRDRFLSSNMAWLEGDITFHTILDPAEPSTSSQSPMAGPGRPKMSDLADASSKTKRRRVDDLVQSRSSEELLTAAEISSRLSGKRTVANLIKEVSECPEKVRDSLHMTTEQKEQRCLSGDEALAYYVESKSTSHGYKQTRKWSMLAGHKVFPSFYSLRKAKKACLPREDHVVVTETRAEIKLQAIMDITAQRLISAQREVITASSPGGNSTFTLISKWGCDGSSGHSMYKQKFSNSNDSDASLFVFSLVPLQLRNETGIIIWQNPRPSSTMYCRPIKFMFSKESTQLTVSETNRVLEDINQLLPTICVDDGYKVSVKHDLVLTMIDGKVCNALTETSLSQKCFICGATPKQMNDEAREYVANKDNLSFGLSTLHAWIRCFECLLHISYRLEVKKWQLRNASDKANVKQRSLSIQARFKEEMGLIVDKPKPGFGSTNDGNTARRFFRDPELSSEITGLDVTLIKKIGIILRTLSSGFDINLEKFKSFAEETRSLYLSLYSWYYMPATVHKILVHGTDVMQSALLPIGQLSEEAQEARNKDCRRFRENNTRKQSRANTNRDLLNMLLITSDPIINGLREVPKKKTGSLPSEVLNLLLEPTYNVNRNIVRRLSLPADDYIEDDSSEDELSDNE